MIQSPGGGCKDQFGLGCAWPGRDADNAAIEQASLADAGVQRAIDVAKLKKAIKAIVVPKKLINLGVGGVRPEKGRNEQGGKDEWYGSIADSLTDFPLTDASRQGFHPFHWRSQAGCVRRAFLRPNAPYFVR